MSKIELLHLLEFLFEYYGLVSWVSFISSCPFQMWKAAGMDSIPVVELDMDRFIEVCRADGQTWVSKVALPPRVGRR